MNIISGLLKVCLLILMPLASVAAHAETAKIAIASNFTGTSLELQSVFEGQTEHRLLLSFGSTGKLTTQILYGAPYDAFLAADITHPKKIVDEGLADKDKMFTYAIGELVLFNHAGTLATTQSEIISQLHASDRIAIANPVSAPYGKAAKQTLQSLEVWKTLGSKIVQGGNIAQTYQFVITGNVDMGFVAKSQIIHNQSGASWRPPNGSYTPLKQAAVLLKSNEGNKAAIDFLEFLKSNVAREIIIRNGYGVEE